MPDVNDDMDELFRKAGENYPLNTNSGDWNEVHNGLKPLHTNLNNTGNKNKYRHLLWLLLLLPFIIITNKYVINPATKRTSEKILPGTNNSSANKQSGTNMLGDVSRQPTKITTQSSNDDAVALKNNLPKANIVKAIPLVKTNISAAGYFPAGSADITQKHIDQVTVAKRKSSMDISISAYDDTINREMTPVAKISSEPYLKKGENLNAKYYDRLKMTPENALTSTDTLPQTDNKKGKNLKNRAQHFYAGLVLGPDATTIKLQKILKTGFTAGILAGYKLNKKWSIESGLYLDKKYYYTEGKYFDTKEVYIPSYTKIEDLDGYCLMIELPVNFKYDFNRGKTENWYALIGSSSYIMKKEDYGYRYKHYGQIAEKKLSYKNSSTNWASVANVAVGYSRNVGKNGTFRIEPYVKIPFKGVGIGSLPITSSGVYLGFTKNLF